ncbi:35394_t:CDS:2 [Gigaspora margarita]|uniref:35394_t:CDS:1 n=1 Tax=Gigaspora margarita TaxID=4874 RepID=A0ABN7WZ74_GIGMA|nr:35394_t:CDS:2 [Gigaspora margarita]
MEFITIGSDNTYTEGSNNYESTDDYESTYEKSETKIPVIHLTKQISYSPFDDCEVMLFKQYSTLPIEYPPISEEDIAIVFNIES